MKAVFSNDYGAFTMPEEVGHEVVRVSPELEDAITFRSAYEIRFGDSYCYSDDMRVRTHPVVVNWALTEPSDDIGVVDIPDTIPLENLRIFDYDGKETFVEKGHYFGAMTYGIGVQLNNEVPISEHYSELSDSSSSSLVDRIAEPSLADQVAQAEADRMQKIQEIVDSLEDTDTKQSNESRFSIDADELRQNLWNGPNKGPITRTYKSDEHEAIISTKFIEPFWESFEASSSIYLDDRLLWDRDASNVGSYHNESYHMGEAATFDEAIAMLDAAFDGVEPKVLDGSRQLPYVAQNYERIWDDPSWHNRDVRDMHERQSKELMQRARIRANHAHDAMAMDPRIPYGEGNAFIRARRAYTYDLDKYFGNTPEVEGIPLSDAQSRWLSDIGEVYGTVAEESVEKGYMPAIMPPDVYDMSTAGVLTSDEAWRVIATAISTIPETRGDGHTALDWPDKMVDAEEAKEILAGYRSNMIDIADALVRPDKKDVTRRNVCLFLDSGEGIRKRYANVSASSVVPGVKDNQLRVMLPRNVKLFGFENGKTVRETLPSEEVKAQFKQAKQSYATTQHNNSGKTASNHVVNERLDNQDTQQFS